MNSAGLERKTDVRAYVHRIDGLAGGTPRRT
jgi:hypothetical protein